VLQYISSPAQVAVLVAETRWKVSCSTKLFKAARQKCIVILRLKENGLRA
jgi:hypothetical protein